MQKIIEAMLHNIPFMALMASPRPANRPMATRLSEQAIVAIISAFVAAYLTQWISNDRQDGQISTIFSTIIELKAELKADREVSQDVAVNKARLNAVELRLNTLDALDLLDRKNNVKLNGRLNNGH